MQETLLTRQVTEEQEQRCLMDTLSEPAFGAVRTTKLQNLSITAEQCLTALQDVLGQSTQSGSTYFEVHNSFQRKGKAVSSYVLCLEQILQTDAGGFTQEEANQVRL